METSFKKYLLNSYVWLHYIAICTNSFIVFLVSVIAFAIYDLGDNGSYLLGTSNTFFFYAYSAISLALINVLITVISTVAIRKFRRNESLNTFQKIIAVFFPLINIPLYLVIWYFHTIILVIFCFIIAKYTGTYDYL